MDIKYMDSGSMGIDEDIVWPMGIWTVSVVMDTMSSSAVCFAVVISSRGGTNEAQVSAI